MLGIYSFSDLAKEVSMLVIYSFYDLVKAQIKFLHSIKIQINKADSKGNAEGKGQGDKASEEFFFF